MRPLWKGNISFGLVNIPVGLYSATRSQEKISFDMLRDSDLSRIHYKRVAEADGKEVPYEHIVKGYQYEKDHYVVVTPGDFQRVQIKSTQTVDIREFVDSAEIDMRYYDEPYFLAPEKGADKAYVLLRETLKQSKKVGIAKVVIRPPREHLAAIQPLENVLLLELLHWPAELRATDEVTIPNPSIGEKEFQMASALVDSMSGKWEPERYHDEYRDALLGVIEEKIKAKGKKLPPVHAPAQKGPTPVIDLVSILQQSLAEAEKGKGGQRTTARRSSTRSHRKKAA